MARNQNYVSLCVAESIEETGRVAWKTIADQIGRRSLMLEQVPTDQQTILYTNREPRVGEIAMYDWSETRKNAAGEMDIRDVSADNPRPIEILELQEFKHAHLEDEHFVRNLLKNGFCIPEFTYQSFISQQTYVAIRINSRTHGPVALLFTDKGKIKNEQTGAPSGWRRCHIENLPDDPNRFMGHIDAINIGSDTVTYKYAGAVRSREFAARQPAVVAKFLPYTEVEMAPLVWKRLAIMAAKSHTLSSGRKLTKAEATELYTYQMKNLQDEKSMMDVLRIDDVDTARTYATGIMRLLQTTNDVMEKNDSILHQVCQLLYQDDTLKEQITAQVKNSWLAEHTAEKAKHEAVIQGLLDDINLEQARFNSLKKDADRLEADIKKLDAEKIAKEKAIETVSTGLNDHIEAYRHDLAKLIADTGCTTGNLPLVIHGSKVDNTKNSSSALIQNLSCFLNIDVARGLAEYIEIMLVSGFHLGVPSTYAQLIADALSVAQDGHTSTVVARMDADCSTNELRRAIMTAPTHVVLLEGVFACDDEFKTLALARHCPDKIIVFSMDDAINGEQLSAATFGRIAMIDDITINHVINPMVHTLDITLPAPSRVRVPKAFLKTGHSNTDKFIETQLERIGG